MSVQDTPLCNTLILDEMTETWRYWMDANQPFNIFSYIFHLSRAVSISWTTKETAKNMDYGLPATFGWTCPKFLSYSFCKTDDISQNVNNIFFKNTIYQRTSDYFSYLFEPFYRYFSWWFSIYKVSRHKDSHLSRLFCITSIELCF